jgi:glycine betaine transporter
MTKFALRTILVPTDFSAGSVAAVEYALALAQRSGAEIVLVHVMEPTVYSVDFALTYPDISSEVRQGAIESLRQLSEDARSRGVRAEHALVAGTPFVEIGKVAAERKADLIVMGTHGRTGLAHAVLGSTAERVVRFGPCPVLTVKAVPPDTREAPAPEHRAGERAVRPTAGP